GGRSGGRPGGTAGAALHRPTDAVVRPARAGRRRPARDPLAGARMSLRPLVPLGLLLIMALPALVLTVHRATRGPARMRGSWWLRSGVVVVLLGLGLGPSVATVTDNQLGVAVDVVFVVDRTGSMSAEDWSDAGLPRLDGVRHDLPALVAALPGARYSIIGW